MESSVGEKGANLQKIDSVLRGREADLALFGELYVPGYMARDQHTNLAEDLEGGAVRELRRMASEFHTALIVGMGVRNLNSRVISNCAVFVSPEGALSVYAKIHLANFGPFEEGLYFSAGKDLVLLEHRGVRLGLMVCYDLFFPELARAYALAGADAFAVISATPATSKPLFDRILPARAVENTSYVLYANLVGTQLNMVFQGGSQAIGPRGETLVSAPDFQEAVIEVEISHHDVQVARNLRPTVRDARAETMQLLHRAYENRPKLDNP